MACVVRTFGRGQGLLPCGPRAARRAVPCRATRGRPPAKGKEDDLKKTLLELDKLWWKGDVEMLRKLAADDLITVSGVGRYDKAALLEAAKHRRPVDGTRRDV